MAEIVAAGWDLSLNRYKEAAGEKKQHGAPRDILRELRRLEGEIQDGMSRLEEMLS